MRAAVSGKGFPETTKFPQHIEHIGLPPGKDTWRYSGCLAPFLRSELNRIFAEVAHGFVEGHEVFDGGVRLDVVDGVEDEPTTGAERFDPFFHFLTHLFRSAEGQRSLGVDSSAPECDLVSVPSVSDQPAPYLPRSTERG